MNRRHARAWLAAALLAAALTAIHFASRKPTAGDSRSAPPPPTALQHPPPGAPSAPLAPPTAAEKATLDAAAAEILPRLHAPDTTVQEDFQVLDDLLRIYRRANGENPVGDNGEITAALLGENPNHVALLPRAPELLDSGGHLLDRWGTPYFFHALSGTRMEIVSAGPDREFHTTDDVAGP